MAPNTDWNAWHEEYDDPGSRLAERLGVVQDAIERWLDSSEPGPVRVLSACAGDGRDLLGVLERRTDASRVSGTLLEADVRNAERARRRIAHLGVLGLTVSQSDAGLADSYDGSVPADLVLLCGIFGNISDEDVRRTIEGAADLCRNRGVVIWTRHRMEPDLTPRIRRWFAEAGFAEEAFVAPERGIFSVGTHRFLGDPGSLQRGRRLFTFLR